MELNRDLLGVGFASGDSLSREGLDWSRKYSCGDCYYWLFEGSGLTRKFC
jgi:hypothetical protein